MLELVCSCSNDEVKVLASAAFVVRCWRICFGGNERGDMVVVLKAMKTRRY